jgi:hypothetical protein
MGYTLKQLIAIYRSDPDSPFPNLRYQVRVKQDRTLERIRRIWQLPTPKYQDSDIADVAQGMVLWRQDCRSIRTDGAIAGLV